MIGILVTTLALVSFGSAAMVDSAGSVLAEGEVNRISSVWGFSLRLRGVTQRRCTMDRNVTINAVDVLGQVGARIVADSRYVVGSSHLRYCAPFAPLDARLIKPSSAVQGESQRASTTHVSPAADAACAPAAASLRASFGHSDRCGAQWQPAGLRERCGSWQGRERAMTRGSQRCTARHEMANTCTATMCGANMGKKRPMSLKHRDRLCASMHQRTTSA